MGSPAVSGCTKASSVPSSAGSFFGAWPTSAGQSDSLLRSLSQGAGEFLPSTQDRLFVQSCDLREQPISTSTNAVGLQRHIPATLLFIQPAQQQIHLPM